MRVFLVLAVIGAAAAQAGAGGSDRPGVVRMDAIAADGRGGAVQDLRADDFEVLEQGALRQIESVQFVRTDTRPIADASAPIASSADEQAAAAGDGARLFAIFLDEYHVSPGAAVRVRAALTEFVQTQLEPRDLVLIARPLDPLPGLRLTRDPETIRQAIASFDGRKGDYTPRSAFERNYIAPDPDRTEGVRAQIVASALNAIVTHLGSLNGGRKTVILVSEGFARPPRRRGDAALPTIDAVIRAANRASASIYPIDPRALSAGSGSTAAAADLAPNDAEAIATLARLASETDGHAILSGTELRAGLQRIVRDASGYYLIAFQPASDRETGRFHAVEVRVKRPGVALRTRPGYWEPLPDFDAIIRKAVGPAISTLQRHASPLIRPWFGLTRGADGKTRVQFVWEPAPRIPGDRSRVGAPARAILNVLSPDGTLLFENPVDAADASSAVFELPPGRVELRIQIEDESDQVLDTDVRDLMVEPLLGPLVLGTAQVLRARNAREFRAIEHNPDAVPVVTRQFSRTERLVIRVPVYAAAGPVAMTARLVSSLGGAMRELPVAVVPDSPLQTIDLPLAGLASGEYRIDVAAASGADQAHDSLTIRVTP